VDATGFPPELYEGKKISCSVPADIFLSLPFVNKTRAVISSQMSSTHVSRVRTLYKAILRLHRGLPTELNELGTVYMRDEFKRHKKCTHEEAHVFLVEWSVTIFHLLCNSKNIEF